MHDSVSRLETFVTRLLTDAAFRAEALRAPERVMAAHGLSLPERAGALALAQAPAGAGPVEAGVNGTWL